MKPDYPKHRKVRSVSRDARLLNIHLWNLADDEGRLQELPQWIIGEVFPTDEDVTPVVLREWLGTLQGAGLITRYEVGGEHYIQCHDFLDHQVINKPRPSDIPPPDADSALSGSPPVAVPDDSHPEEEGNGREGEGKSEVVPTPETPLSNLLADLVAENDPNGKRPNVTKRWTDAERLLIDRDGRLPAQAERLLQWCQANSFWAPNIQSMPKFREKYSTLWGQATRESSSQSSVAADLDRLETEKRRLQAEEAVAA